MNFFKRLILIYLLSLVSLFSLFISKAFDKKWHEGLLYKLRSMGISGEFYNLLEHLSGRFQRVVLNGQTSSWRQVWSGVPQGSILGPLLFLSYINNSSNELKSSAQLFADHISLFTIVSNKYERPNILNNDLLLISKYAYNWKMLFNPAPSKPAQVVLFSKKKKKKKKIKIHSTIIMNNMQV